LWLGLTVLAMTAAPTCAVEPTPPQIDECRIGFDGTYKVGHWTPVWVKVSGDESATNSIVEVTAIDSDGVDVTILAPAAPTGETLLYTRVGRLASSVQIRLRAADGRLLDRAEISPQSQNGQSRSVALPATGQLVVQIGPATLGIESLIDDQEAFDGALVGDAVQLVDVESLPTDWFGYDAVDVLVLTTNDVAFCERLVADTERFAALRKWVDLGGRLVLCGSRNAPKLLGPGMPLAEFVPGKINELVRLPQTQALESYAGSGDAISQSGAQQNIPLPRLVDAQGRVELFGRRNEYPIIVRAAHGFGELVFVGVDLAEPPFADWNGRRAFLQAVFRPYLFDPDVGQARHKLVSLGYDDLAGALRQRLGRSFAGVTAIGFPWVAALIIGYLLFLGPLDYWFVDRVTRRPWVAWLTLPIIVLTASAGAAVLANVAKTTTGLRINHAELVDFDLTTGWTRGFNWATLYSPRAERLSVSLTPQLPDGRQPPDARALVSWLGLPGTGLGGMQAAGEPLDVTGVGYRQTESLGELIGLPVLTAATKSLVARWAAAPDASVKPKLVAQLSVDDDGLLVGTITNNTGTPLADAYLLHGQWGYRLGDLQPGQQLEIDPRLNANRVKSIIARHARSASATEQDAFLADRANVDELLSVMMFYEAVGGEGFAGLPNQYQADADLSRLLTLDRAILVASGSGAGSENGGSPWIDAASGKPLETEPASATVVYRFILPVGN
jgi:hypothetical protein